MKHGLSPVGTFQREAEERMRSLHELHAKRLASLQLVLGRLESVLGGNRRLLATGACSQAVREEEKPGVD